MVDRDLAAGGGGSRHLDESGQFRSTKHPDLPPDRLRLNMRDPRTWGALREVAISYRDADPEFAADVERRVAALEVELLLEAGFVQGRTEPLSGAQRWVTPEGRHRNRLGDETDQERALIAAKAAWCKARGLPAEEWEP